MAAKILDHRRVKALPPSLQKRCPDTRIRLVDIGASGGLPEQWESHQEQIEVLGFEPDGQAFRALEAAARPNQRWFNIGLHSQAGPVDFFVTRKQTCSSCLEPNMGLLERFVDHERFQVAQRTSIPCRPLDDVLAESGVAGADFLKIDTQGSELAILSGAEKTLRDSAFGVEAEVWFLEAYKEQPLHAEIDSLLRGCGFDLIDLRAVTWKRRVGETKGGLRGQLVFGDALYFKQPDALRESLEGERAADRLLRAVGVCLIYGYVDYALELVACCAPDHFDAAEIADLERYVDAHEGESIGIPQFSGRRTLSELALRVHELLAPQRHRHSQQRLGNRLRTR
jgi:FkbM family methyltransferase